VWGGSARGVRIPKVMLEESGLSKGVEIRAKKGEIKITPLEADKKSIRFNDEYLLSLSSLSDWDTPEEDEAWKDLQ
jgi:antitoxin component of MazEF toxin-antitoxin module